MPIFIPQSALDKAIVEDKKARGVIDEIPINGFSARNIQELLNTGISAAKEWCKKHGKFVGVFGPNRTKIYVLKQRPRRKESK